MAKTFKLTQEQMAAFLEFQKGAAPVVEKPKRSLAFNTYVNDARVPASAASFGKALATGADAAAAYAHAPTATRGISAVSLRAILSDPTVAAAARVFLASLG